MPWLPGGKSPAPSPWEALGKLHAALAGKPNPEIVAPEAKAVTFFQAAILVCPRNYMAANELGVLFARNGDLIGARRMLEHSVLVNRRSENFNNLSVVYRRLGQQRLAELATQKALAAKVAENARQRNASPGRRLGAVGQPRRPGPIAGTVGRSLRQAGGDRQPARARSEALRADN